MTKCHTSGAVGQDKSIFALQDEYEKGGATLYPNICDNFL